MKKTVISSGHTFMGKGEYKSFCGPMFHYYREGQFINKIEVVLSNGYSKSYDVAILMPEEYLNLEMSVPLYLAQDLGVIANNPGEEAVYERAGFTKKQEYIWHDPSQSHITKAELAKASSFKPIAFLIRFLKKLLGIPQKKH